MTGSGSIIGITSLEKRNFLNQKPALLRAKIDLLSYPVGNGGGLIDTDFKEQKQLLIA